MSDVGTREAAKRLGVTQSTVAKYYRLGLFEGATQDGKRSPWHIPKKILEEFLTKKGEKK